MRVYLVRHAHAVDRRGELSDEERYLSPSGRDIARSVGRRLAEAAVSFDVILTSPLVRAVQTAELIAAATGFLGLVEATNALRPGSHPAVIADVLGRAGGAVAAVGHEPTIAALGAYLLGRPSFPPFLPGQVCLVEPGQGRAGWKLVPTTLEIEPLLVA